MPVFEITTPSGRRFQVTAPEGATQEEVLAFAVKHTPKSAKEEIDGDKITRGAKDISKDGEGVSQAALNLLAGGVRGAGSIGATLLAPIDMAKDAIDGKGLSLESNRKRRADMDATLKDLGAQDESLLYKGGKLAAEVAGSLPVGGLMGKAAGAVLPAGKAATAITEGLASGGFRVGGATGKAGLAARVGTGAASGAASAGLVNPDDALAGALVGGIAPPVIQGLGKGAEAVTAGLRGKAMKPASQLLDSAEDAINAGYILPPATVNPTFANRAMESVSGKMATQQIASVQNQETTKSIVRKALNLAPDAPIDLAALETVRKDAGKAYKAIADLPVAPGVTASSVMNRAPVAEIKPKVMIEELKQARNDAQSYFKAYNVSANPEQLAMARAADAQAAGIEQTLEDYAQSLGRSDLLPALREARMKIAQTYTVERALNDSTGSIDATVLGKIFKKGKPLSDGLETVGRFGAAFPSVAKLPEKVGSPDSHNLKAGLGTALGLGGMATTGPAGLAAAAIPFVAPPIARARMFSESVQGGLVDAARKANAPAAALPRPRANAFIPMSQRALPVLGAAMSSAAVAQPEQTTPPPTPAPTSPPAVAPLQKISEATTVDQAIDGAFAALETPLSEAAPVTPAAIYEAPTQTPVAQVVQDDEGGLVEAPIATADASESQEQPASIWTGRRGAGYLAPEDALTALPTRQRNEPDLDWRVERMPNERYRLAGYPRPEGEALMESDSSQPTLQAQRNPSGTVTIAGDPQEVIRRLREAGITTFLQTARGVLVGTSQADEAMQLAGAMA